MLDFALGFFAALFLIAVYTFLHLRWMHAIQAEQSNEKITRLADGTLLKSYKPDNATAKRIREQIQNTPKLP